MYAKQIPKDRRLLNYFSKRAGFPKTEDYYKWCSCKYVMSNVSVIIEV